MRFRVAWKSKTGLEGRGNWLSSREVVEAWVKKGNEDFPELKHWVEVLELKFARLLGNNGH